MSTPQVRTQVPAIKNAQILIASYSGDTISHAFRELGNTDNMPLAPEYNEVNVPNFETSDGGSWLHHRILNTLKIGPGNVYNNDADNFALALNATRTVVAQSASSASAYAISTAVRGGVYSLGRTASLYGGHHSVSNVVVNGSGGTPTYTVDTDYKVDAEAGLLYITEDSTINGVDLEVDYDYAAKSSDQIVPSDGVKYYQVMIRESNPVGPDDVWLVPKVSAGNDGAIDIITPQNGAAFLPISFNALKHPDYPMFLKNGAPYTP